MFGFPNRSQGPTGPTRTPKVFEIRQAVKNNNRTEVLLPERPVPRCHGARCVGAESSLGPPPNGCEVVWNKACTALQMPNGFTPSDSYATWATAPKAPTLTIGNPLIPSPPSLRSFLLSGVSSRSTTATIAGHGRGHREDHDQYDDVHHRRLFGFGERARDLALSLSFYPLTCSLKWTRKKRFSCFVLFFFILWMRLGGFGIYLTAATTTTTTTSKHKQTRCDFFTLDSDYFFVWIWLDLTIFL